MFLFRQSKNKIKHKQKSKYGIFSLCHQFQCFPQGHPHREHQNTPDLTYLKCSLYFFSKFSLKIIPALKSPQVILCNLLFFPSQLNKQTIHLEITRLLLCLAESLKESYRPFSHSSKISVLPQRLQLLNIISHSIFKPSLFARIIFPNPQLAVNIMKQD